MPQWITVINKETGQTLFSNHPVSDVLSNEKLMSGLEEWLSRMVQELTDEAELAIEELELSHDDLSQFFLATISPLEWNEQKAVAFIFTDISAERKHIKELEDVAFRDNLTKLYNRHYGMMVLDEWLEQKKSFFLCFVDMDNLKYVNDKLGHSEGDVYILHVANILRSYLHDSVVCRLGGDEFLLLIPNTGLIEVEHHMEALRAQLISSSSDVYTQSISYGVVEVPVTNSKELGHLLSIADEKMYTYKRKHKAQRQSAYSAPTE
jgi:diguanylate cyclase (GGDEF)-like protein